MQIRPERTLLCLFACNLSYLFVVSVFYNSPESPFRSDLHLFGLLKIFAFVSMISSKPNRTMCFLSTNKTSQVTYVTMVPRVGNETLRPLGVAMGNALSVTRV